MGNSHTTQTKTETKVERVIQYKIPPELLEKLNLLETQKKDSKQAIKKQQQMKALICSSLEKQTFPTKFPQKRVAFLGRTSTGKSSLINKLFGTKLKVAAGRCTSEIKQACQLKGVKVYDVPGFEYKFNLTSDYDLMVDSLGQINAAYVLFESVTDVEDLIAILLAMNRRIYGIRTKCDSIDQDCQLSLKEEIERDKNQFKKLGVNDPEIFATSKKGGFDNQKLIIHILGCLPNDIDKQINFQEVDQSIRLITEIISKVKGLSISTLQRWKGCEQSKMELIDLLATIRTKLEDFKELIVYKIQKLKEKIDETVISKFCLDMHPLMKILLGISFLTVIGLFGYLGLAVHKMLPPPPSILAGVRAVGLTSLGAFIGIGAVSTALYLVDKIYSYYQACQNKEKFSIAVQQTKKTLEEIKFKMNEVLKK